MLSKYSLIGYHCTRLTDQEIAQIRSYGMQLQNFFTLRSRIKKLADAKLLSSSIAERLELENQAGDGNRAHMLWFCFYEPYIAGEFGVGRLFRSWGGEALYNSHEHDSVTGSVLRGIGKPCVIMVSVPISSLKLSKYPDAALARVVLSKEGHRLRAPVEHVGCITEGLSNRAILRIFEYPEQRFIELTKCNEWQHYIL